MKINKFFSILLLSALAMPVFTACDSDTDSNPVFHEASTFVLNESAYAANNTYSLGVSGTTIDLTCNQPDYGFPVATTYAVQAAFDNSFAEGSFVEMSSTFNNTRISIDASELNTSLVELWNTMHEGEDVPTEATSIYIRLRAVVTGQTIGNSISNVICLPKVLMSTSVDTLTPPEFMWLAGTMSEWGWVNMAPVYGLEGQYYRVVYFADGGSFKFGTKENEWLGFSEPRLTLNDNANAGVSEDGDGNIVIGKGGWYLITMKTAVKGKDYAFTMNIDPAKVYIIGACEGGNWSMMESWMFTDSGNGTLVSPPLAAAGEVRMCVDAGLDWWRTEFTLKGNEIYYRDLNIVNNWAEDAGSEFSIAGTAGMVIELDFNNGTGSTK